MNIVWSLEDWAGGVEEKAKLQKFLEGPVGVSGLQAWKRQRNNVPFCQTIMILKVGIGKNEVEKDVIITFMLSRYRFDLIEETSWRVLFPQKQCWVYFLNEETIVLLQVDLRIDWEELDNEKRQK